MECRLRMRLGVAMVEVEGIDAVDDWIASMIKALDSAQQKRVMHKIGVALRRENQKRMTKQIDPDGRKWAGRAPIRQRRGTRGKAALSKRYNLNYKTENGDFSTRPIILTKVTPALLYAVDIIDDHIKTFRKDRVISLYNEAGEKVNFLADGFGANKSGKMMQGLRRNEFFRIRARANDVRIGYRGVAGRIAEVHQQGFSDTVRGDLEVLYPIRQLIGISSDDKAIIERVLTEHFIKQA